MRPTLSFASMSIAILGSSVALCAARQEQKPVTPPPPVSSVSLSFMPGTLTMSEPFAITLKKDGTAVYVVKRVKQTGTYKASGLGDDFEKVEKALNDCGYWNLQTRFGPTGQSSSSIVVSVKSQGNSKSVVDAGKPQPHTFGRKAPVGLKQVEQLLGGLTQSVKWTKVSDKADFSGFRTSTGSDD